MACPSVTTGSEFLVEALSHIDCQAQTLGSFGFQSLALPGSPAGTVLIGLLTLFVALYGIRLLFGAVDEPRDLVSAVLKVGIVLTIAVSWPAWRVIAYDTVLRGPAEVAAAIMPSTLPDPEQAFAERLQSVDSGMAALAAAGTGRQTAEIIDEGATSGFRPIALEDEAGLGWSRPIYLASTLGSLAALRIAGGLLLALAPLMAGLLLFDFSRGLFAGWLRGLALVAIGSLGLTVLFSVQVAIMEPWIEDVLSLRGLGYATPAAPTEMLALVTAFAIAAAGLMFLLAKVAFQNAWSLSRTAPVRPVPGATARQPDLATAGAGGAIPVHSRAIAISESVTNQIRREEGQAGGVERIRLLGVDRPGTNPSTGSGTMTAPTVPLGSGYRRTARSGMPSQKRRDDRK